MDNPLEHLPLWRFDGSSTYQATGEKSDLLLQPVVCLPNPMDSDHGWLVYCEVLNADGSPHHSNSRAKLRQALAKYPDAEPQAGIEQEYTLYGPNDWPLGWPSGRGFPSPQGRYYCGVGYDEVKGRKISNTHMAACIDAGIAIKGTNSEVMPAQWEFQIGTLDALTVADHLWIGRWLLYRLAEDFEVYAKLDPKPMNGDWNGAGESHSGHCRPAMLCAD